MFTVSHVLFLHNISTTMMRPHSHSAEMNDVHHIFSSPVRLPFALRNRNHNFEHLYVRRDDFKMYFVEIRMDYRLLQLKHINWRSNGLHISCKYLWVVFVYKIMITMIVVVMIAGAHSTVYAVHSVVVAHASHANNSVYNHFWVENGFAIVVFAL